MKSICNSSRLLALAKLTFHRSVCAMLVVTFAVSALPIWAVTAGMQMGGDCCQGKGASHCETAILKKVRQRKPEPMCGLKTVSVDDRITIVAESYPEQPRSDSTSVRRSVGSSCPMDCCATASSWFQKKKDGSTTRTEGDRQTPVISICKIAPTSPLTSSLYSGWNNVPRGPPEL